MKKLLASRRRILGMRDTQLRIATGDSALARGAEDTLHQRRRQLKSIAAHMHEAGNACREGRALHAQLELVDRLRHADDGMAQTIDEARQRTAEMERQRVAAFQKREIADRLAGRAAANVELEIDRKIANQPRAIPRRSMESRP